MKVVETHIDKHNIPKHIAIIMDGNGRWAKEKGHDRTTGHHSGGMTVREIVEVSARLQVSFLTLYAFSAENWNRPQEEVAALMKLLIQFINDEQETLLKNNIRLKTIGDTNRLPQEVRDTLLRTIEYTSSNKGLTLVLALSYSGHWEITESAKLLAQDVQQGQVKPNEIDTKLFAQYLQTSFMPDPELLIRTSGEIRISNFLLWQLAYTELYFTDIFWPDFNQEEFYKAIYAYQQRERRLGKTSEQIADAND